jgi:hypothetical protein
MSYIDPNIIFALVFAHWLKTHSWLDRVIFTFFEKYFIYVFLTCMALLVYEFVTTSVKRWKDGERSMVIVSSFFVTTVLTFITYAGLWQTFPPDPPKPPAGLPQLMSCQTVTIYNWQNKPAHVTSNTCSLMIILPLEPR